MLVFRSYSEGDLCAGIVFWARFSGLLGPRVCGNFAVVLRGEIRWSGCRGFGFRRCRWVFSTFSLSGALGVLSITEQYIGLQACLLDLDVYSRIRARGFRVGSTRRYCNGRDKKVRVFLEVCRCVIHRGVMRESLRYRILPPGLEAGVKFC